MFKAKKEITLFMLEPIITQLRASDPHMLALLLRGSYARAAAGPHSDLDLLVLHQHEPDISYRSLIIEQENGRLLHITIGYAALDDYLAEIASPQEAELWSLFLPVRDVASLLWAAPQVTARLPSRFDTCYAISPQLQDMLECVGKLRNAYTLGDELGVRLAAQGIGQRCPALLAAISPISEVQSPLEAVRSALDMDFAIQGYREDLPICLGLSGQATSIDDIHTIGMRLACAVLEVLRPHAQQLGAQLEPNLPSYLTEGLVMRLLTQAG